MTRRSMGALLVSGAAVAVASACTSGHGEHPSEPESSSTRPRVVPGQLLDLSRWKLTEPVARRGGREAREIQPKALKTYSDQWFCVDHGTVRYTAPARGATTSSSSGATRSELREMAGSDTLADWSLADGRVHELTATLRCDATRMNERQEVVVGQIHGAGGTPPVYLAVDQGDPQQVLQAWVADADPVQLLTGATPSTWLTYRLRAHDGVVDVWAVLGAAEDLPAAPALTVPASAVKEPTGLYFKAGCYNKQQVSPAGSGYSTVHHRALTLV